MNKRGAETFMAEKTANIILAVISIVVLLLLGYALFGMIFAQQEYQQAKATIEGISETIDSISAGGSKVYIIESPKNWGIFASKNNLCSCKSAGFRSDDFYDEDLFLRSCKSTGICIKTSSDISIVWQRQAIWSNYYCMSETTFLQRFAGVTPDVAKNCYNIYRVPVELNISVYKNNSIVLIPKQFASS